MSKELTGIFVVDTGYVRPEFDACYLVVDKKKAAIIETGTSHSVHKVMAIVQKVGLKPEDVEYIIPTHAHLDHSGGASSLMQHCPKATLLAHPRAAKHLIDPTKLVASATQVYGVEKFKALYGTIEPIPESRVRVLEDGESVTLGARTLQAVHVRGHANHHLVIFDSLTRTCFTGDAFGLRYPTLQKGGLFVFPSTSPTDFDGAEAQAAIEKIVNLKVNSLCLTHYGPVFDVSAAASQMKRHLEFSTRLCSVLTKEAKQGLGSRSEFEKKAMAELKRWFEEFFTERSLKLEAHDWSLIEMDIVLNAQGLAHAAEKTRPVT